MTSGTGRRRRCRWAGRSRTGVLNRNTSDTGAVLALVVCKQCSAGVEHDIRALFPVSPLSPPPILIPITYIIKRTPTMPQLNNLHRSHHALPPLIATPCKPRRLERLFQLRLARLFSAENPRAGLVEHLNEADVEISGVGAKSQVHGCEGVFMGAVYDEGTACSRPESALAALAGKGDRGERKGRGRGKYGLRWRLFR